MFPQAPSPEIAPSNLQASSLDPPGNVSDSEPVPEITVTPQPRASPVLKVGDVRGRKHSRDSETVPGITVTTQPRASPLLKVGDVRGRKVSRISVSDTFSDDVEETGHGQAVVEKKEVNKKRKRWKRDVGGPMHLKLACMRCLLAKEYLLPPKLESLFQREVFGRSALHAMRVIAIAEFFIQVPYDFFYWSGIFPSTVAHHPILLVSLCICTMVSFVMTLVVTLDACNCLHCARSAHPSTRLQESCIGDDRSSVQRGVENRPSCWGRSCTGPANFPPVVVELILIVQETFYVMMGLIVFAFQHNASGRFFLVIFTVPLVFPFMSILPAVVILLIGPICMVVMAILDSTLSKYFSIAEIVLALVIVIVALVQVYVNQLGLRKLFLGQFSVRHSTRKILWRMRENKKLLAMLLPKSIIRELELAREEESGSESGSRPRTRSRSRRHSTHLALLDLDSDISGPTTPVSVGVELKPTSAGGDMKWYAAARRLTRGDSSDDADVEIGSSRLLLSTRHGFGGGGGATPASLSPGGGVIHHQFPDATIGFVRVLQFDRVLQSFSVREVLIILNEIFSRLDAQIAKFPSVYRVKTVGEDLMFCGGVVVEEADGADVTADADAMGKHQHLHECINCAFDMFAAIRRKKIWQRLRPDLYVGLHTGPVIAGVVGGSYSATFDIWSDVCNVASRLCHYDAALLPPASRKNAVHVTDETFKRLEDPGNYSYSSHTAFLKGKGQTACCCLLSQKRREPRLITPRDRDVKAVGDRVSSLRSPRVREDSSPAILPPRSRNDTPRSRSLRDSDSDSHLADVSSSSSVSSLLDPSERTDVMFNVFSHLATGDVVESEEVEEVLSTIAGDSEDLLDEEEVAAVVDDEILRSVNSDNGVSLRKHVNPVLLVFKSKVLNKRYFLNCHKRWSGLNRVLLLLCLVYVVSANIIDYLRKLAKEPNTEDSDIFDILFFRTIIGLSATVLATIPALTPLYSIHIVGMVICTAITIFVVTAQEFICFLNFGSPSTAMQNFGTPFYWILIVIISSLRGPHYLIKLAAQIAVLLVNFMAFFMTEEELFAGIRGSATTLAILVVGGYVSYMTQFTDMRDFFSRVVQRREKQLVNEESKKTDGLLRSILPQSVISRIVRHDEGSVIADSYDCVGVIAADAVRFTELTASIDSLTLLNLLNYSFQRFDRICDRYDVLRLHLLGDMHLSVSGAPPKPRHLRKLALAAIEMASLSKSDSEDDADGSPALHFRIGVHCGPAIAGVVQSRTRISYDVFGGVMEVAMALQAHGEVGNVICSDRFALSYFHSRARRYEFRKLAKTVSVADSEMTAYWLVGVERKPQRLQQD